MMIPKYYTQALYFALLLVFLAPMQFSCTNDTDDIGKNNSTSNNKSNSQESDFIKRNRDKSDEGLPFVAGYSPLSYEKYTDLREDTDSFSLVRIAYRNDSNYDQGVAQDYVWVGINGGGAGRNFVFSSIDNYKGSLHKDIEGISSPNGDDFFSSFSPEQVESIYSYLESNNEYFFNGEEYQGMTPPVDSEGQYLIMEDHMFYLSFTEPSDRYYAWAIHKCMDEPDPILQGLIDIINTQFISQFE